VDDGLKGRVRDDGLVKGIFLGNVFYDGEVELVFAVTGVGLCDLVGFFLGADGCDDAVAVLQKEIQNMRGDKARAAGEEDTGHGWECCCGICLGRVRQGIGVGWLKCWSK
jgi:hypothetical protein